MNYSRIFDDYKEELELALIQNSVVECELYSIIASVIRESESGRKISLRDVSARRTTETSKYLKGDAGFPDFIVLERIKNNNAKRLGCIDIKKPNTKLEVTDKIIGHINSYGKVIFTDGLLWIFFENVKKYEIYEIGVLNNSGIIEWNNYKEWFALLEKLDSFKWI